MKRRLLILLFLLFIPVFVFTWTYRNYVAREQRNVALVQAIQQEDLAEIRRLVLAGADPNVHKLYKPARESFLTRMRRILFRRSPRHEYVHVTPLYLAAAYRDIDLVRLLLAHGANPNLRMLISEAPLHAALGMTPLALEDSNLRWDKAKSRRENSGYLVTKALLEHRADPNAPNMLEGLPLRFVIAMKHRDLERLLLTHGAKWNASDRYAPATVFWTAARYGRIDLARKWLAEGADPNEHDDQNCHILIAAVENGHLEAGRMLLKAGADPNARDSTEFGTPLKAAVGRLSGRAGTEMVRLLLDYGARPDLKGGEDNLSSLEYAERYDEKPVVRMLQAAMKRNGGVRTQTGQKR